MPFYFIQPLSVGNAVRVFITPPAGAKKWRLLRKTSADFSGRDDPAASVIHDGVEQVVIDYQGLLNNVEYHYAIYGFDGAAWTPDGTPQPVTPKPTFENRTPDVLSLVRERIDLGLQVAVARGALNHPQNHIQVLTAPPKFDESSWPVVTAHCQSDSSDVRGIGEEVTTPVHDGETDIWDSFEGWLSRWTIQIIAWSLNPDERIELRKQIKTVLIANLGLFKDVAGMDQIDVQQSDLEDFTSFNAPVYQALTTLTCVAPTLVSSTDYTIHEVIGRMVEP